MDGECSDPPPRKRSLHTHTHRAKIRPKRTTLIDEFLDENSQLRNVFFPDHKIVRDPMKYVGNNRFHYSRSFLLDTDGKSYSSPWMGYSVFYWIKNEGRQTCTYTFSLSHPPKTI